MTLTSLPRRIDRLEDIATPYSVILCDVWGVIHNGKHNFAEACDALARIRSAGKTVVLVTNSPRPRDGVERQLARLGVPDESWDRIVTSGDVTRALIATAAPRIFHMGPDRDLALYDGLDVELVEEREASTVCCTGLFNEFDERPEDYAEMLRRFRSRNLPFICANPDIVVEHGGRLIWCAGALARDYGQLGGRTLIAGKPFTPIYEAALGAAADAAGKPAEAGTVLAIGDGILTDIKGALSAGLDALYISDGIHAGEYGGAAGPDAARLGAFLSRHGHWPVAYMARLQ